MIAVSSAGERFDDLAGYLESGRARRAPERVAWSAGRNLPTNDPATAAVMMRATAAQNRRIEQPVYHLILSAPPGEQVGRARLEAIADRVLRDLGLAEHQALLVAHRDKDHPHVHVMVNRVHPETRKAWSRWQDQPTVQRALRAMEQELGLTPVPGRLYQQPGQEPPQRPRLTRGEQERAARTGIAPLVERARDRLPDFRAAVSWRDLEDRLSAHGLQLARKGQGLVITDGETEVKASRIARDVSLRRLEERFGVAYDQRAHVPALPADVARLARDLRVYERVETLNRAGFSTETEASAAAARRDQLATAIARAEGAHQAFGQRMAAVYRDPAGAIARFHAARTTEPDGRAATIDALRTRPDTFGPLATVERRRFAGLVRTADETPARSAAVDAAALWQDAARAEGQVVEAAAHSRVRRLETEFGRALGQAYRDPAAARAAWDRLTAEQGPDAASAVLRSAPAQLGALRTADGAPTRSTRFHTTQAATLGVGLAAARAATVVPSAERPAAEQDAVLTATRRRVAQRDRAGEGLPSLEQLGRSIAQQVHRLAPPELTRLFAMLTAPQSALVARLRATVRDLALGRDEGLDR